MKREYSSRQVENLSDAYMAKLLGLSVKQAREHPGLLELKRLTVQLTRAIRDQNKFK